ncbi:MAG: DNA polymerase III subunit delta [Phycisphaera sp.]|nr:DNA polymerase III subunit delta [Phycisphaera sp.]
MRHGVGPRVEGLYPSVMAKRGATAKKSGPVSFTGDERIVVLHGEDLFLQREQLRALREAMEEKHGDVEQLRFEGKSSPLADVLDELRSFGLMQQHKIVVVEDADPFVTTHREALERYAAEPVDMATLVLRPGKWNAAWKLHKAIAKVGAVCKCEAMSPADALNWTKKRAKDEHNAKITAQAASLLVEHLGSDLGRLDSELAKLAVNVGEGGTIEADAVEELVGFSSDEMAWEIQQALLGGRADDAIAKLHELVELSGQPDVLVTYFVADMMRKLHHAAVMLSAGRRDMDICKELRVWGDRSRPFMSAARKLGRHRAAQLLAYLVDLDRRSKSGFGQTMMNLERFCVQFAAAMR